jgi:hypothetical protein
LVSEAPAVGFDRLRYIVLVPFAIFPPYVVTVTVWVVWVAVKVSVPEVAR